MDITILEELGLTKAEVTVFIALTKTGTTTAGKIITKTGLQNAVVHRAFHTLIEKGLISYSYIGKTRSYKAIQPNRLLQFIEQKKAKLEKLIPELEALANNTKEQPEVEIYRGKRGVKELILKTLEFATNTQSNAYGGSKTSETILGKPFWELYHKTRIEKNIKMKILFHKSLEAWGKHIEKNKATEIRYTHKNFESTTETFIVGDKVIIILYLEQPFGFLIDSTEAAHSYSNFFKIIWKASENNTQ